MSKPKNYNDVLEYGNSGFERFASPEKKIVAAETKAVGNAVNTTFLNRKEYIKAQERKAKLELQRIKEGRSPKRV